MFYIITIPHQKECRIFDFHDEGNFINYVQIVLTPKNPVESFSDAIDEFCHDLHSALVIKTKQDRIEATKYGGHKMQGVRALAEKIDPETLD